MAFRVPVPDVSVVDLTVRLEKAVSVLQLFCIFNTKMSIHVCQSENLMLGPEVHVERES